MNKKARKLLGWKKGDTVVALQAEDCRGPGWANRPFWVIIRGVDGNLREECLQVKDQPADMQKLFPIMASVEIEAYKALWPLINDLNKD